MKKTFLLFLAVFLTPMITNAQVLFETKLLPNMMVEYRVGLPVLKKATVAYISGEMTEKISATGEVEWERVEIKDSDGDGYYEYTFVTWNRLIKFYYSAVNINWNPLLKNSNYFDEESGCWIIGFVDQQLLTAAEFKPIYPGTWGDGFIRGEMINNQVCLMFNCQTLSEPTVEAFVQLSGHQWKEEKLQMLNSWGWGMICLKPKDLFWQDEAGNINENELWLGFGGYSPEGKKVWPRSIDKSRFYVLDKGFKLTF